VATAAEALEQHGLNGARLLAIARSVASDTARRVPYMSPATQEDLISFLVATALATAVHYDPEGSRPGYAFSSYLWDVMSIRTTDFFRRKAEGFTRRRPPANGEYCPDRASPRSKPSTHPTPACAGTSSASAALASRIAAS
jgi:hypothetical protein